jgi:hypothetical protein
VVPGVQDPDSTHRAFHRASGQSRSLDGRQNRYSYVIIGAIEGFDGEAVGLNPPLSLLKIP